ncbi:MAG: hypothetical protein FWD57_07785 [Polyangiaceae bacterium]|nr:hypothetical protein [Polyangiaceae bacterium]
MSKAILILLGASAIAIELLTLPRICAAQTTTNLAAAAQASTRPKECRNGGGERYAASTGLVSGPGTRQTSTLRSSQTRWTIWDHARQPYIGRYCDLLGKGQSLLDQSPSEARQIAMIANGVLPGYAAPLVLAARADVRLRDYARALTGFVAARAIDPRSAEDPGTLRDLALAQRHAGSLDDAIATYRILIPRLDLLPNREDRIVVLLEAASLYMHAGHTGLSDSIATLATARALIPVTRSPMGPAVLAMHALVLDRASSTEESDAIVELIHRGNAYEQLLVMHPSALSFLIDANEWNAVMAFVAQGSKETKVKSAALWERYIEANPSGPYLAHAKARLALLRSAPVRSR